MSSTTVRVRGLDELARDLKRLEKGTQKAIRKEIAGVAQIVVDDARDRAARFGAPVVSKIKPRTRGMRGYATSRAKSKGIRPDFGVLLYEQAFIPAAESKEDEVVEAFEGVLDRIATVYGL